MGRAYVGDTLVADQFYSGRVWDIGLDRLPADALHEEGLRLRVLPLHADARVYVPTDRGRDGRRRGSGGAVAAAIGTPNGSRLGRAVTRAG